MPTLNTSHQGTLRGSVTLPVVEAESDGEVGYKTALSELECDDGSDAEDPPPRYSRPGHEDDIEDDIEVEELPDEPEGGGSGGEATRRRTPEDSPAYVAPIGKIPKIPSVQPLRANSSNNNNNNNNNSNKNPQPTPPPEDDVAGPPPLRKTPSHQARGGHPHLVGKTVDEFGDVVDDDGAVLGRVEGDLPAMVGRAVANARGDVLGDDGELLGRVADEAEADEEEGPPPGPQVPTWSLADVVRTMAAAGQAPGGLRVDAAGNILDPEGRVVGSFHDNVSGFGRRSGAFGGGGAGGEEEGGGSSRRRRPGEEEEQQKKKKQPRETPSPQPRKHHHQKKEEEEEEEGEEGTGSSSRSQQQPRENAQSHRKEDPKESPSDIFLDVKSTTEGIQLTIRIPTVFNSGGQPAQPRVVFS